MQRSLPTLSQLFLLSGLLWTAGPVVVGQEPRPLFNGKDLSGWVYVNTTDRTWKVEDGLLVCSGKPIGEIRTDRMFQNFEMEVEWRHMVPGGNAGIFVWADDITARGVPFHRGIEVQVLENAFGNNESHTTHGDIFPIHGATMTPLNGRGSSRAFPTENRAKPSPEWNHYRIVGKDGNISLAVNGKVVTQGKDASPRKGYICLESEGGVVHYRNIRITEFPDTPVDPEHIAIADRGYRSLYNGLDLSGWEASDAAKDSWRPKDWVLTFDGKTSAEQSLLTANQSQPLAGFIVDFRFKDKSEELSVSFGQSQAAITIRAKDDDRFAKSLQKSGAWNRLEGSFADGHLVLKLNEKPYEVKYSGKPTALAIRSSGPIELANLYVRDK